jgi:methionyl-tRNA formyltransferase
MSQLRIVFMGTPEFAVPSLQILIENNYHIAAVITAPDKPQGRGQKILYSPVKMCALKHNLVVLQPDNLKSSDFLEQLKSFNANLQIVVAFRMLPEAVWAMPSLGTFNLHASLLPQYRGAAPINWAIINGEKETGVTTFFLKHEIDTGNILFQENEPILDDDDAGSLYSRLMIKGAALVLKTVRAIENNDYVPLPQPNDRPVRLAPKIFKENCEIDWKKSSGEIRNFVRGLSPHPAAWATIAGKTFKIFKVTVVEKPTSDDRAIHTDNKNFLHVRSIDGWVSLDEIQPEGKKRMTIQEFFRGNKLTD